MARLGTCPICVSLCGAFLALSLLVLGLGTSLALFPVAAAGIAGTAIFLPLVVLHAVFYVLRREEAPAPAPAPRDRLHPVAVVRASCCGRRA